MINLFVDINLDEVKEGLEDGTYLVMVSSGEQKTSNNGNPGIRWELEIQDPPEFQGWAVSHWTPLTGRGRGFLKQFLEACEFEWGPDGFHIEDVIGYELEIDLEAGEGDDFDDITDMRPA